jgi:uncharacterized damage-inducible protein DinB
MPAEVDVLLNAYDRAYSVASWHGTNLRGSIRGVTAVQAVKRPGRGRHNIQEEVVHCAYWKYAVWRTLTGANRGSFPLDGSNWFSRPHADRRQWQADIALLTAMHGLLRNTIAGLSPRALRAKGKGQFTAADLVAGITAHDLYHAGQIQLIKRLIR